MRLKEFIAASCFLRPVMPGVVRGTAPRSAGACSRRRARISRRLLCASRASRRSAQIITARNRSSMVRLVPYRRRQSLVPPDARTTPRIRRCRSLSPRPDRSTSASSPCAACRRVVLVAVVALPQPGRWAIQGIWRRVRKLGRRNFNFCPLLNLTSICGIESSMRMVLTIHPG